MNSLILDTRAVIADTRLRRTALSVRSAVASDHLVEKTLSLDPAEVYTHTNLSGNKGTVIYVSKPVSVTLTLGSTAVTFVIESTFVLTTSIAGLVITNNQAVAIDLFIVQC